MTLGEKIKACRKQKGLTQSELCSDRITRNMLSLIENGVSMPSVDTLLYICERLDVSPGYLLSESEDEFTFRKNKAIAEIRELFSSGKYSLCIEKMNSLSGEDEEICYLQAHCNFYLATDYFYGGSFTSASRHLSLAQEFCRKTPYDTSKITSSYHLYSAICSNVNSPLLEFDEKTYTDTVLELSDTDLYNYLIQNLTYEYKNPQYSLHARAKLLMKERKYTQAVALLKEIEDKRSKYPKNAYLIFSVYSDLDTCYRQLCDFESAYKYATKRISLLEGFST